MCVSSQCPWATIQGQISTDRCFIQVPVEGYMGVEAPLNCIPQGFGLTV